MDCPSCSHRPFPAMLVNLETLHALTELHWSAVYELFDKTHRSSLSWPPLVFNSDMHNGKVAKDSQRDRLCLSFPSMSSVPSLFGFTMSHICLGFYNNYRSHNSNRIIARFTRGKTGYQSASLVPVHYHLDYKTFPYSDPSSC